MHLSQLVRRGQFVITCELGSPKGVNVEKFLNEADLVKDYVDAINVGDNQRAVMRAGPLAMCHLLKARNIEPLMELTTRDRNSMALQSELLGAAILGIENILFLTGHDPAVGDHAQAKPVYELDCASLVNAAMTLSKGKDLTGHALDGAPNFCIGVVATPGLEPAELHLAELKEQIAQGAQFIQTQAIYEPQIRERFIESIGRLNVPVMVGHVMLKSAGMASFMNSNFPGVSVPEKMIRELTGLPKEKVIETSLQISIELLKKIKPMCSGIHFMPAGWERYVPRIIEAVVGKS